MAQSKSKIVTLILLVLLISCTTKEFKYNEKVFLPDGSLKQERLWNIQHKDEVIITYTEQGDTLIIERFLYPYLTAAYFYNDTIDYRFYGLDNNSKYLQELLICNQNSQVIKQESSYIYLESLKDSLRFKYIGDNLSKFSIVLYSIEDTDGKLCDTILSPNAREITIANKNISCGVIQGLLYIEVNNNGDSGYAIRSVYFDIPEKIKFQEYFNLLKYFEQ